jgi:hypothetical protein
VQKVLGLAGATVHSLQVFTADPEHRVPTLLGAAHGTAKPTDEPGRRPQVGWVEPGRELDGTVERPQEHVAVLATVADRERHAPWCPPRARPAARASLRGAIPPRPRRTRAAWRRPPARGWDGRRGPGAG